MAQTTIQRNDALRFGSAVLEIGPDFSSLTNVGAIRDLVFTHKGETVEIEFDNTDSIKFFKKGQKGSFTFLLAEIDMTILSQVEEGLVNLSTVPGTLVMGAVQLVTNGSWSDKTFIPITNQNGNCAVISITSVVGSVDGALTAAADDFEEISVNGVYGIVLNITEGAALTTAAQNITITYNYTPSASKNITFNDFGQKTEFVARITNTNSVGNALRIDLSGVTNLKPLSFPLLSDNADDVSTLELELDGVIDLIVDEQSTT